MIEYDINEEYNIIFLEFCQETFQLFISLFVGAVEHIRCELKMIVNTIIRFRESGLLNRCKMECIVTQIHLLFNERFPFFDGPNATWKQCLFSEFPQLDFTLHLQNAIEATQIFNYVSAVVHEDELIVQQTRFLKNVLGGPSSVFVEVSSQYLTVFAFVYVPAHDQRQYHFVLLIGVQDQDGLVLVGLLGPQAEEHRLVRMAALYVGIVSVVIDILILKLDHLIRLLLHI